MLLFSERGADFLDARLENTEARPWGTEGPRGEVTAGSPRPVSPHRPHLQEGPAPFSPGSQTLGTLWMPNFLVFSFYFFFLELNMHQIGAATAGLCHRHSNARSECKGISYRAKRINMELLRAGLGHSHIPLLLTRHLLCARCQKYVRQGRSCFNS